MSGVRRPIGFGGIDQVSAFLGVPRSVVERKATSGEWPSYVIGGRRVFNIDELLDLIVELAEHKKFQASGEGAT